MEMLFKVLSVLLIVALVWVGVDIVGVDYLVNTASEYKHVVFGALFGAACAWGITV